MYMDITIAWILGYSPLPSFQILCIISLRSLVKSKFQCCLSTTILWKKPSGSTALGNYKCVCGYSDQILPLSAFLPLKVSESWQLYINI